MENHPFGAPRARNFVACNAIHPIGKIIIRRTFSDGCDRRKNRVCLQRRGKPRCDSGRHVARPAILRIKTDLVVGASVGAINASYFASAPDAECVGRLEQIWCGLRRADIFPFSLTNAFGLVRHRGYIVDPGKLRRVVETNLPCSRIEDAKIPLHIMATTQQGIGIPFRAVLRSTRFWRAPRFLAFFPPLISTAKR